MKGKKTELRIFTIADWEKEERYLQKRHQEGWKFKKLSFPVFYSFEKCAPEDVVYLLDYDEEGQKHKDEYIQKFKDRGWEYLQEFCGYSYFRKPIAQIQRKEDLFRDDKSKLGMMRRVFAGRYIPILIVLAILILPNLVDQFQNSDANSPILLILFLILFVIYVWAVVSFAYRYWKLKKRLE